MPRVPKYNQQRTPSGRTYLPNTQIAPRMPYDIANTGEAAVAQGLGDLGQGLAGIGEALAQIEIKKQQVRDDTALASANSTLGAEMTRLENEINRTNFTSPLEAQKAVGEYHKQLDKIAKELNTALPSIRAQERWGIHYNNNNTALKRRLQSVLYRKEIETGQSVYKTSLDNLHETMVAKGVPLGDIQESPERAELIQAYSQHFSAGEAEHIADYNLVYSLMNSGRFEDAKQLAKDSPLIVAEEEDKLIDAIEAEENADKLRRKKDNESLIESERLKVDEIFKLPIDEFLDRAGEAIGIIDGSVILPVKDKDKQRDKINKRLNAYKQGKTDPVDEFDSYTYSQIQAAITANPKSVSEQQIRDRRGLGEKGGLTNGQIDTLIDLKRKFEKGDVLQNETHQRYSGVIKGLKTAKAFSGNKVENELYAVRAQNKLDAWAVKNPDATAEDYQKFFDDLMDTSEFRTWNPFNRAFWYSISHRETGERRKSLQKSIDEETVRMSAPNGDVYDVPKSQVKQAEEKKWKKM